MTFYLKYRPQTIDELDLGQVREKLTAILREKAIPHAFLLAGPKGLGKTSAARIFAKTINCKKRETQLKKGKIEPCDACDACRSVREGRALDLVEIDGASNRGIDDIRRLKESIGLMPSSFQFKVYVIDEVHMLTLEAFNALLKTLEEPPPHAVFILCTTNPEKIPATIRSRTIRVDFPYPAETDIIRSLERVAAQEKLPIEPGALAAVACHSDRSFRDAHKLLEQLVLEKKPITAGMVNRAAGMAADFDPEELFRLIAARDIEALRWLAQTLDKGMDPVLLTKMILERLRQCLLGCYGLGTPSKLFTVGELRQLIDLFSRMELEHPLPALPLEIAVMEFYETMPAHGNPPNPPAPSQPEEPLSAGKGKKNAPADPVRPKTAAKSDPKTARPAGTVKKSSGIKLDQISAHWPALLTQVQPLNHSVAALLRSARPATIDGCNLTIEVNWEFHKSRLETPKINRIVSDALQAVCGTHLRIHYRLRPPVPKTGQKEPQAAGDSHDDIASYAKSIF